MSLLLDALKQAEDNKKKVGQSEALADKEENEGGLTLETNEEPAPEPERILELDDQEAPAIEAITPQKEEPKEEHIETMQVEAIKPEKAAKVQTPDVGSKAQPQNIFAVGKKQPSKERSYKKLVVLLVVVLLMAVGGLFLIDQAEDVTVSYKDILAEKRQSVVKKAMAPNTDAAPIEETTDAADVEDEVEVAVAAEETAPITSIVKEKPSVTPAQVSDPSAIKITKRRTSTSLLATLNKAYKALLGNDLQQAKGLYQQVLSKQPKQIDALLGLANIEIQQGGLLTARGLYERVLRVDETNSVAQLGLLQTYQEQDLISQQQVLEEVIGKHGGNAESYVSLGNAYSEQSKWSLAQDAYFKAFSLNNSNAIYAYNLAVSLDQMEQYAAAKTYYLKALSLNSVSTKPLDLKRVEKRLKELDATYE
jgi:tetratricopeptide (TPR) repeat protein